MKNLFFVDVVVCLVWVNATSSTSTSNRRLTTCQAFRNRLRSHSGQRMCISIVDTVSAAAPDAHCRKIFISLFLSSVHKTDTPSSPTLLLTNNNLHNF